VADIIADAHEDNVPLLMSVVNAGEVWYIIARRTSEADADRSIRELKQLGIQWIMPTGRLLMKLGDSKLNTECLLPIASRRRWQNTERRNS
jgi:hypothetical protein